MKIGFDISQTGSFKAGCGYFADSVIKYLSQLDTKNQYLLYRTFGDHCRDPNFWKTTKIKERNFHYGLNHNNLEEAYIFWQRPIEKIEHALGSPDILHSNNYFCPRTKLKHTKLVYTLYDLSYVAYPEWTTELNRIVCFNSVWDASMYADYIVAISESTRQDFLKAFPYYPKARISTILLASRYTFTPNLAKPKSVSHLLPEQFWLSVGTLEPRKNYVRLAEAYARLKKENKIAFPLVIAGGEGWMMENFYEKLQQLEIQNDVIFLGYADEETLQWLYQNCFCFVYPSLFEGFGLPVLEAMSLGACVITSSTTSLPEIIGDAGIMVNPFSSEEIFQAMNHIAIYEPERKNFQAKARLRAAQFSWKKAAQQLMQIYNKVINF